MYCFSPLSEHEKLQKLDDSKKFAILKKGIGMKVKKLYKQVKDQKYRNKMKLNDCYRTKVDSEAFAIPILTASAFII